MKNTKKDVFEEFEKGNLGIKKEKYLKNLENEYKNEGIEEDELIKEFFIPVRANVTKTIYASVKIEACNFSEAMEFFNKTPERLLVIVDEDEDMEECVESYEYDKGAHHYYEHPDGRTVVFDPKEVNIVETCFNHVDGQELIWSEQNART